MKQLLQHYCTALLFLLIFPSLLVAQVAPKREFRAVWIATINNIDWPAYSTSDPVEQREQFKILLNHLQQSGINAVFVQVRPSADAFYHSNLEPWSEWLTGEQGIPPNPYYDPLEFMVAETHRRNMEFHAWFNPYRAIANRNRSNVTSDHITKRNPHWFMEFGSLTLFNPGVPAARQHIVNVISDVLRRYDIDGVHFDDYFYPYPSNEYSISDATTYRTYGKGFASKADWRRYNVDMLIKEVHEAIQKIKPKVKFGVSPYGVWRNSNLSAYGSETTSGLTSYDHLYADVRNWLQQGWVDYIVPQLYQNSKHKGKPYKKLVDWWANNSFNRHLYIGHATYRIFGEGESKTWHDYKEMPLQVRYLRRFKQVSGSAFYGSKALLQNKGSFKDSLQGNFYRYPAIIPPMAWKDPVPPLPPAALSVVVQKQGILLRWESAKPAVDGELPSKYVVYRFKKDDLLDVQQAKNIAVIQSAKLTTFLDIHVKPTEEVIYAVTSLDRMNNESTPVFIPDQSVEETVSVGEWLALEASKAKPTFNEEAKISENYDITYKQASYFYRLALKSMKVYVED